MKEIPVRFLSLLSSALSTVVAKPLTPLYIMQAAPRVDNNPWQWKKKQKKKKKKNTNIFNT